MESTIMGLYRVLALGFDWGYIGVMLGLYRGYFGIMEKKLETTIMGLHGFRVYPFTPLRPKMAAASRADIGPKAFAMRCRSPEPRTTDGALCKPACYIGSSQN